MSAPVSHRLVRIYAALVGAMDTATGVALIAAPAFTLTQMGAQVPGAEALAFVRFVGVFVGAVGASYLFALALGGVARLRTVLEVTAVVRVAAGLFTGVAVATGYFDPAWLAVTGTDLTCAAVQVWILMKGCDDRT